LRDARGGELADALTRPAVVAVDESGLADVLTHDIVDTSCEILALHTVRQWAGIGTSLVAEVARLATGLGCARYWVVTTNHNIDALRFYRRRVPAGGAAAWRRRGRAPGT
jgi:GNAT superfamily N-acetyltransferase